METLTPGHKYKLNNFENKGTQTIQFIEKIAFKEIKDIPGQSSYPQVTDDSLITINEGTTNEEVLVMLIDRMNYLQAKFPCRENALVITKLEESLMWLLKRTEDRIKRNVEGKQLK